MKNGIRLIEGMMIGVLTKSKIETLPKIVVTLKGILIGVSIIEELTGIEVDVVNVEVNKTIELCEEITMQIDEGVLEADLVAEEVSCSLVD